MKKWLAISFFGLAAVQAQAGGHLEIQNGTAAHPLPGGTGFPIAYVVVYAADGFTARLSVSDTQNNTCHIPVSLIVATGLSVADVITVIRPENMTSNVYLYCDNAGAVIAPNLGQTHASTRFDLEGL